MKLLLVFDDWKDASGYSLRNLTEHFTLSEVGMLHYGATFAPDDLPREEIEAARAKGFYPVFRVVWKEDDHAD